METVKRLGGDPKNPFPLEEELQTEAAAWCRPGAADPPFKGGMAVERKEYGHRIEK